MATDDPGHELQTSMTRLLGTKVTHYMNLEKRIRELEARFQRESFALIMADGREHLIAPPRGKTLLDVYSRIIRNPDCEEAQLLRNCVATREPGGGRVLELAKAVLPPLSEQSFDEGSDDISPPPQC